MNLFLGVNNFMVINRKAILDNFLDNITNISDREYQKRVWIRAEGPECDDLSETICEFCDGVRIIFTDYKNYNITDAQYRLMLELRNEFKAFYNTHYDPSEFIYSPEWEKIMQMAKNVLIAFNFQKKPFEQRVYEIQQENILDKFLDKITEISNREHQKKAWILGEESVYGDFDKIVSQFRFSGAPIFEDYKKFNISDAQYDLLLKFRNKFEAFCSNNNQPHEFSHMSEWEEIRQMAKEVLEVFDYT